MNTPPSAWEPAGRAERQQLTEDARVLAENARMYARTEPMGAGEASAIHALADAITRLSAALHALDERGGVS